MAVAMRKTCVAAQASTRSRARVVVTAHKGESSAVEKAQIAVASFTAAAMLMATPAQAGVVLEQPKLKKIFVDDAPAAPAPKPASRELPSLKSKNSAAPAPKAAEAPKAKVESSGEGGPDLDVRSIALPGSVAFVAGAYLALSKLDSGFADFAYNAAVRNSNEYAGFEPAIKSGAPLTGTKKVKASKKK